MEKKTVKIQSDFGPLISSFSVERDYKTNNKRENYFQITTLSKSTETDF